MSGDDESVSFEDDVMRLMELLRQSNVRLRRNAIELVTALAAGIERWNRVMNLVSGRDIRRLVSYHFCDSASLLPIVRPQASIVVLDVGGSNGLPGLVLSALSPAIRLTICDSKLKRRGFLEEMCQKLGPETRFEIDRVDSKRFQASHVGIFDLIVTRAVARLKPLFKWCLPLLKPGGRLTAYKGSRCLDEVTRSEDYLFSHGGRLLAVVASPWADVCNPLRLFAIAARDDQ